MGLFGKTKPVDPKVQCQVRRTKMSELFAKLGKHTHPLILLYI